MRCVHGSDDGGCEELSHRNAMMVLVARTAWDAEVVHIGEDGTLR